MTQAKRALLRLSGAFAALAVLATPLEAETGRAHSASRFLDSIGANTSFPDRGQPLAKTIEMIRFTGIRWVRAGIEGLSERGPTSLSTLITLHKATGVRYSWGLVSGGYDLDRLISTAQVLAKDGALIAIEGNNEPNNWPVKGPDGRMSGGAMSWAGLAALQRDLYARVKATPELAALPVWSPTEVGAQTDNVGLQFLTVPEGCGCAAAPGTRFADVANVHNYIYHPNVPGTVDNQAWNAASPGPDNRVDGLYGNFGRTWLKKFPGLPVERLAALPWVTTETGMTLGGPVDENLQAAQTLSIYLSQFARGASHTSLYILRDRTDEGGNQSFGLFDRDYRPRKSALGLRRLTRLLASEPVEAKEEIAYRIDPPSPTRHELLLARSDGQFALVVWSEKVAGEEVAISIEEPVSEIRTARPLASDESAAAGRTIKASLSPVDNVLVVSVRR